MGYLMTAFLFSSLITGLFAINVCILLVQRERLWRTIAALRSTEMALRMESDSLFDINRQLREELYRRDKQRRES